jgi:lysyl-tRNA synthetase class 2
MTEPPEDRTAATEASPAEDVLAARRAKLERLRARGVEPFALRFDRDATAAEVRERFGDLEAGASTGQTVRVAGRLMGLRRHGRLWFGVLRDTTGDLQLFLEETALGPEGWALLEDLDLGDWVGAEGEVMTTRRGELSVKASSLVLLTKSLRPLPEKWHGVRDPELRLRRRYLEFATDPGSRRVVDARATAYAALREELDRRGFVEVETPVLHVTAGGAIARPFVTHHRALGIDLYLRIALELYLKRLLVGGMERVYEIGRNFRNEGIDRDHNPEFSMLEAYQAFGDYEAMMELGQALVVAAARAVRGSLRFEYQGRAIDLEGVWPRITVLGSVAEATGEEISLDRSDLADVARRHGIEAHASWGPGKVVLELFEKLVEGNLGNPTFVCDFPREVSPLARPHRSDPGVVEHYDLIMAGMEIIPAYSELSDPDEQRRSFEIQREAREKGEEETHPLDEDFLVALEHGMPPAGGLGLGLDRLLMILADVPSIREVILFPAHRPES